MAISSIAHKLRSWFWCIYRGVGGAHVGGATQRVPVETKLLITCSPHFNRNPYLSHGALCRAAAPRDGRPTSDKSFLWAAARAMVGKALAAIQWLFDCGDANFAIA
jgi:hypothetical protein